MLEEFKVGDEVYVVKNDTISKSEVVRITKTLIVTPFKRFRKSTGLEVGDVGLWVSKSKIKAKTPELDAEYAKAERQHKISAKLRRLSSCTALGSKGQVAKVNDEIEAKIDRLLEVFDNV